MITVGGYIPGINLKLSASEREGKVITAATSGISTSLVYDCNITRYGFTGVVTGKQYSIQIVPEQILSSQTIPTTILYSSNSGIATLDPSNNTIFVNTGTFQVIGNYLDPNNIVSNKIVSISLTNTSGSGISTVNYSYSPLDVNINNNILIVYNTRSNNSINLKTYYTGKRPNFSTANVLPINCTTGEIVSYNEFSTGIRTPIYNWITGNIPSKNIRYLIMMSDIPTRVSDTNNQSVSFQLSKMFNNFSYRNGTEYYIKDTIFSLGQYQGTSCLVSYINFGNYYDCTGYIDKISANQTGIYLTGGATNTGYYFEDCGGYGEIPDSNYYIYSTFISGRFLRPMLLDTPTLKYLYRATGQSHITTGQNLAGFSTWGANGGLGGNYATNGQFRWGGNRNWYIMATIESFNGTRSAYGQQSFTGWFSSGAFGGSKWENCPVGAVGHVEEPYIGGVNFTGLFYYWNKGFPFINCAWMSRNTPYFICFGDPLIVK